MFKIEGLDELQLDLQRAQDALSELDGEFGIVSFNPDDPSSIDLAVTSMENLIDRKVAGFEDNDLVASLVEEMKEEYRRIILEKAAEFRIKGDK
ncbi:hypothetical protein [Frigidibacter sp.]|uniref:hypothetical protein n=1 Tax=Frigidibacter sp. TaxID=2586418 RepID=UPI0027340420|nr:hypothetical protein [Frigidibacter sp.]MDP3340773.1 hypothetical protein [Frigidibacter sp.]